MLEEIDGEGGTDEDMDPILGFETGSHLFVGYLVGNSSGGGIGIFREELLGSFDGKSCCLVVVRIAMRR